MKMPRFSLLGALWDVYERAAATPKHGRGVIPDGIRDHVQELRATRAAPRPLVCFMDETGVIAQDRFFGVGVLTVPDNSPLAAQLGKVRQRNEFTTEWHFCKLTNTQLRAHRLLLEALAASTDWTYHLVITDRDQFDLVKHTGDRYTAYEAVAAQALTAALAGGGQATVIADEYPFPVAAQFEQTLRDQVNSNTCTGTVGSVVRISSIGHNLLQASDVLTGAATYPMRVDAGLAGGGKSAKARLARIATTLLADRINVHQFEPANVVMAA